MSLAVGPTPSLSPTLAPAATVPRRESTLAHATPALRAAYEVDLSEVPVSRPPIELQPEVQFAAQRAAQLSMDDRELHFTLDDATGRVVVQVRDLEGNVIKTVPNRHALDVLAGAEL